MTIRQSVRKAWILRALLASVFLMRLGDRLVSAPKTQQDAEAHLERPLLFYDVWEGTPHVVFEFGGTVHLDRLTLDMISIEWPPTPRWQWTGDWWTIDAIADPASIGVSDTPGKYVMFGQINAEDIVWLDVQTNGQWSRYPVSHPGFAIRLPEGQPIPDTYRWLDAADRVIWTVARE